MSTVKVVDLISRAHTILLDTSAVRWTALELQGWLNDAYKEIVTLHPDANTQTATFTCSAGYRQDISATYPDAYLLLEVIVNKAATSKKKPIQLVSRKSMDTMRPGWYTETSSVNIEKYMYDGRTPKEFLVYPPATTLAQLEIMYATVPAPHTLRAYNKDAEQAGNAERAAAYYQAMVASLNFKVQSDESVQPGTG